MQEDLERALKKPVEKRSWQMVIDVDKCIGCNSCSVACVAENVLPPGVSYRVVVEVEEGVYPDVRHYPMPTNCQQCDNPPCVKGLPEDFYTKRPDGILVYDYSKMKGEKIFRQARTACPYTAVYHDTGGFYTDGTPKREPYEAQQSYDYGDRWVRTGGGKSPVDAVRKCHFCLHRLESGMIPACVTTCVGGAMYFGDKNDPKSLINELIQKRESVLTYEDEGTGPRVVYLTGIVSTAQACANCHG
jgi:molybdopterin-containing oxidoreductase family iron-sulfur binding subunit